MILDFCVNMFLNVVTVKQSRWTFFLQASGICYNSKLFRLHQVLCVPIWMANFFSWTLEPIFSSPEPTAEARIGMGATVDIQRQQRMELLDRQLMLSQFAQVRRQRQQVSNRIVIQNAETLMASAHLATTAVRVAKSMFYSCALQCG